MIYVYEIWGLIEMSLWSFQRKLHLQFFNFKYFNFFPATVIEKKSKKE